MHEDAATLAATALQPGLIWAWAQGGAAFVLRDGGEPPEPSGFRWLHLNLSDQRSHRWIERAGVLRGAACALFLGGDGGQRLAIDGDGIAFVVQAFERDFDRQDTGRIAALRIAITPELVLTGRHHALHSADVLRGRLLDGASPTDPAAALELILAGILDTLVARTDEVAATLLAAEDELLTGADADSGQLVTLRRRCTRLHRIAGELRLTLQKLQAEPRVPAALAAVTARSIERLITADSEIAAAQAQLRLLRDELDLRAAQRTNQNIYVLSVLTALMMPATLVTGFFGMNTGGLPLVGHAGTGVALGIALIASAGTYAALRLTGLTRR